MACPACGAAADRESCIGALGNIRHYICRYCGMGYMREVKRRFKKATTKKEGKS